MNRHESWCGPGTRPFERLWLSAGELRVLADQVGATVVVAADLPVDLADVVKERRRLAAAALRSTRWTWR